MLLATTSAKVEFVLGENHATNQIPGYAAWFDSATSPTASSAGANSNDTTQVTIVASPGASVIRQINEVTICNTDTIAHTVKVRFNDGTNQFIMVEATLPVGASLIYSKQFGWAVVSGAVPGQILGTATNDNAAAGNVGEYISSFIASGSAVSLTNSVAAVITSISLTPGDWDVRGSVSFNGTTSPTAYFVGLSDTTAFQDNSQNHGAYDLLTASFASSAGFKLLAPVLRFSLATTKTINLLGQCAFTPGTLTAYGYIEARRMR